MQLPMALLEPTRPKQHPMGVDSGGSWAILRRKLSWPCRATKAPTFFDGAYMVYFVETCGATSTVVARVWGAYLTYIVDTFGAISIVVAIV